MRIECQKTPDTVVGKTPHLGEVKGFERARKYYTRDEVSVCIHTHMVTHTSHPTDQMGVDYTYDYNYTCDCICNCDYNCTFDCPT